MLVKKEDSLYANIEVFFFALFHGASYSEAIAG